MIRSIDNRVADRLKADPEFRREWFRAELEQGVPELFRSLREERQLTQSELADKVEMKQSAISRFEQSSSPTWKIETLLRLADALDARLIVELEKYEHAIADVEFSEREPAAVKFDLFESLAQQGDTTLAHFRDSDNGAFSNQSEHGNLALLGGKRRAEGQYLQSHGDVGGKIPVQGVANSAGAAIRQANISARNIQ